MVPRRELGVEKILLGGAATLLQAGRLRASRGPAIELVVGTPSPHRERSAEAGRRPVGVTGRGQRLATIDQALELVDIEVVDGRAGSPRRPSAPPPRRASGARPRCSTAPAWPTTGVARHPTARRPARPGSRSDRGRRPTPPAPPGCGGASRRRHRPSSPRAPAFPCRRVSTSRRARSSGRKPDENRWWPRTETAGAHGGHRPTHSTSGPSGRKLR